jgi:cyclohexanecarboxylate-CoA ligase
MPFTIQLSDSRRAAMHAAGLWPDRLFTDYLDEAVCDTPDKIAVVAYNVSDGGTTRLSYADLARNVERLAVGLYRLGVKPGEVVSFQLPNWWQFVAVYLACVRIGAVANPLMPIFRQRELRFMLGLAETRVVIAPRVFRGFDHGSMLLEMRSDLPALQRVLLIGGEGEHSFEKVLQRPEPMRPSDVGDLFRKLRPGPDEPTQLMFTSGTTGEPKGVMHTPNTLIGTALSFMAAAGTGPSDTVLMPSPLAHQSGFLYGMGLALVLKTKLVLQDVWTPQVAGDLIEREQANYMFASTPFLADLTNCADIDAAKVRSLRRFVCSGAPIPGALVERATQQLGFKVLSGWGMTESGLVTLARPDDPPQTSAQTDGRAIHGMEVRAVDESGALVAAGVVGRLQARGVAMFVGYLKRPELGSVDEAGWFETGDLARMDERGYLRITGRSKDVIIRGGENIPVVEIESLLYRHPKVMTISVVGMPDARLGERACAFVLPKPGEIVTLADVREFLEAQSVAKQYWPERVELVTEMPVTPSGKIQKFKLRELARSLTYQI